MSAGPPRLAERLLLLLSGDSPSAEYVLGDLREEYAAVRARWGGLAAWLWFWLQALAVPLRIRAARSTVPPLAIPAPRFSAALTGDRMRNDIRLASRALRRRPLLSGVISLTVGLAIAATTVAFAVVDGVLLEDLPFQEPDRLVNIWEHSLVRDQDHNVASPANYFAWRDEFRSVQGLATVVSTSTTITGDGDPERIGAMMATASWFPLVGATPLIGRLYVEADDQPDAPSVTVLSEGFWRRRFGADPGVVGRTITLNGSTSEVIGVLPARFDFEPQFSFSGVESRDVWFPPRFGPAARGWSGRYLQVMGRLAPGASVSGAQQEASTLASRLRQEFSERQAGWDVNVVRLKDDVVGDVRMTLIVVFGAVCFVLLIACANVANLLLTRAASRHQEMAVRAALGAGRGRLVRQLMLESLILATVGGAAGLLLAQWGVSALVGTAPDLPRLEAIGLDLTVIGFAMLATVVTALLFGLVPALHLAGGNLAGWLSQRGESGRRRTQIIRSALVATQVALCFVLLVGAGLLIRSLTNRLGVDVGLNVDDLLTAEVSLPGRTYDTAERRAAFFEQTVDGITALPGVREASAISIVPLSGTGQATSFLALDLPVPEPGQAPVANVRWVHHAWHRVAGVPLREGRLFDERDRAGAPLGVIINETGARQLWPGESAIGKRIQMEWGDTLNAEVIGVVGDVRDQGPDVPVTRATLYWDHRQSAGMSRMVLTARAGPEAIAPIREVVRALDPELPLYNVRTMESLLGSALARARFTTVALGTFAGLALVLAAIGLYGVMAYVTGQREREIGIRMALGADGHSVVRMVMRQGMTIVVAALAVGAVGAIGLTRLLRSLVFDISPTDPFTFVGVALLLAGTAWWACWMPARRASSVDPVEALRSEA